MKLLRLRPECHQPQEHCIFREQTRFLLLEAFSMYKFSGDEWITLNIDSHILGRRSHLVYILIKRPNISERLCWEMSPVAGSV